MTPRERAQALRVVADLCVTEPRSGWVDDIRALANELDPPVMERWERLRDVSLPFCDQGELHWRTILAEANKGMISESKLRAWVFARPHLACFTIVTAIDNGELSA